MRLTGGARLAGGGLHLGHLVGALLPMLDFSGSYEYTFVIKDTEPLSWKMKAESNATKPGVLFDMLTDVLSLPFSERIRITTTSRILRHCFHLYSLLLDLVTFNTLVTTHFKKVEFRERALPVSVKNFLFPVDEVAILFALRTDYLVSNDDNLRVVRFARDIGRRLQRYEFGNQITLPELRHHRRTPRLLGFDYRRMCKAHQNTIGVSASSSLLAKQAAQLTSWKYFFSEYVDVLSAYQRDACNFSFPQQYLPFVYVDILTGKPVSEEAVAEYSQIQGREKLAAMLYSTLEELIGPIRERKSQLYADPGEVWERLDRDSAVIQAEVAKVESGVMSTIGV